MGAALQRIDPPPPPGPILQEDDALARLVEEHGAGNWSIIARELNDLFSAPADAGRIGKQCRERWNHHLRPDIRKGAWTAEEEELLVKAHRRHVVVPWFSVGWKAGG